MSDMEQSDVTPEAPEAVPVSPTPVPEAATQPEPVPVRTLTPSSDSPTQAPEAESDEGEKFSVEDAARAIVVLVRAHRTIGDVDLAEAIDVLDAEYPPTPEPDEESEPQA